MIYYGVGIVLLLITIVCFLYIDSDDKWNSSFLGSIIPAKLRVFVSLGLVCLTLLWWFFGVIYSNPIPHKF